MPGCQARGEGMQNAHIPGKTGGGSFVEWLISPLHADGDQGEGTAVDGGWLHQWDDEAAHLAKGEVAQGKQDYLQKGDLFVNRKWSNL